MDCPTPLDASTTVPPPAPGPLDPLALLLHWLRDTWALLVRRLVVWSDPASGWIPWLGSVFQRVTKAGGWYSGAASALQSKSSIQEVAAKPERVRGVFEALTERELRCGLGECTDETVSELCSGDNRIAWLSSGATRLAFYRVASEVVFAAVLGISSQSRHFKSLHLS